MLCSGQKGLFAREKVPKWGICKPGARRAGGRKAARPGSRGAGRPWFAYENRIHWLTEEAYANGETLPAEFRRGRPALVCVRKPNSLPYRGGVRKPGDFAGRVQEGTAGLGLRTKTEFIGLQRNRTQTGRFCQPSSGGSGRLWFAYENRIHWLSREASANRGGASRTDSGRPGHQSSRSKTEFTGFQGRRARTGEAARADSGRPGR